MAQTDIKAINCLGSGPGSSTESKGRELDKMVQNSALWKIINHGTAKYEWTHGTEKQSIIAQAECKYWFKDTEAINWVF